LEALKVELINKYENKPILLIEGAYAFVCAYYLVCISLGNKFLGSQVQAWMELHQLNSIQPTKAICNGR